MYTTRNKYLLLTIIACIFIVSCQRYDGYRAVKRGSKVYVTLEEYQPAFRNPMKGLREFFSPGIDTVRKEYPYPYGSMIKEYMQWNMMEKNADDNVKSVIDYSNHRWKGVEDINMKVIPRTYLVWIEPWHGGKSKDPENPDDLNGWHWPSDMPAENAPYKNVPGEWACYLEKGDSLTPITGGYFDKNFPDRVRNLVRKLGMAWDNDPRVAYVEMGIIGEWGEQHDPDLSTYWPPHDEPKHVANRTWISGIQSVLGDAFTESFKNKKVMVRYAYEFKDYNFGIYWDSFAMPEEYKRGYLEMKKLGDRWKTQPMGGEITWNWGSFLARGYNSFKDCVCDSITHETIIDQIHDLHMNHLGGITWTDFNDDVLLDSIQDIQKSLGYRFVLEEAVYDATISKQDWKVQFKVRNQGSSPFYYNWPVYVNLINPVTNEVVWRSEFSDVDIRSWLPGDDWNDSLDVYTIQPEEIIVEKKFNVPILDNGNYIVALSINDPAGNLPSVRFANTSYLHGGYTALGYVSSGKRLKSAMIPTTRFVDVEKDTSLHYSLK